MSAGALPSGESLYHKRSERLPKLRGVGTVTLVVQFNFQLTFNKLPATRTSYTRIIIQGRAAVLEGEPDIDQLFPFLLHDANCNGTEARLTECRGASLGGRQMARGSSCGFRSVDLVCFNSTDSGVNVSFSFSTLLQVVHGPHSDHAQLG